MRWASRLPHETLSPLQSGASAEMQTTVPRWPAMRSVHSVSPHTGAATARLAHPPTDVAEHPMLEPRPPAASVQRAQGSGTGMLALAQWWSTGQGKGVAEPEGQKAQGGS